jgi:hypothetical protein
MSLIWDDVEPMEFRPKSAPDEWYKLRPLSAGDNMAARNASVHLGASTQVEVGTLDFMRVRRAIVAWSHIHNGEPVPIEDDTVARIDSQSYVELIAEVDRLNPLRVRTTSVEGSSPTSVVGSRRRQAR